MEDKILYHGSKGGIIGTIKVDSHITSDGKIIKHRDNCDFGKGFYLGESEIQTLMDFENNNCTDIVLMKALLSHTYENQITFISQEAANNTLEIIEERKPNKEEIIYLQQRRNRERELGIQSYLKCKEKYNNQGLFLNKIIKNELIKERRGFYEE